MMKLGAERVSSYKGLWTGCPRHWRSSMSCGKAERIAEKVAASGREHRDGRGDLKNCHALNVLVGQDRRNTQNGKASQRLSLALSYFE